MWTDERELAVHRWLCGAAERPIDAHIAYVIRKTADDWAREKQFGMDAIASNAIDIIEQIVKAVRRDD